MLHPALAALARLYTLLLSVSREKTEAGTTLTNLNELSSCSTIFRGSSDLSISLRLSISLSYSYLSIWALLLLNL